MKQIIRKFFLSFFYVVLTINLFSQDEQINVDQTSGSGADLDLLELNEFNPSFEVISSFQSCLPLRVSFSIKDQSLVDVIKQISNLISVTFTYDNKLQDIKSISFNADNEPLYSVLNRLLSPYNISYYEYEDCKLALAKTIRIDEKTGGLKGIIRDENRELVIGVNVMIKELRIGCASDMKGNYSIKNIIPGEYTLELSCVGYEKCSQKIRIRQGEIIEMNITMKSCAFQIGGIEVIGTTELLPNEVTTKTTITSGEIEHFQASSIKDVLDLVPGVQKSDNPGLGKTSQIALRGDESNSLSAFGTLIIVDGTPMSNNANLQFESLTGSKFGSSDMGRGLDLRTIPADNIENLEVITGLPSVRYGDVTSGVINVQSKIGAMPNRLKLKNNPDTREGNFGGGIVLWDGALSYNFNAAQSERDIRVTGDEYLRLTGQLVYSSNYFENRLSNNTKILFQRVLDEEEPKGDMLKTKNYNRDYTISFSTWGKF